MKLFFFCAHFVATYGKTNRNWHKNKLLVNICRCWRLNGAHNDVVVHNWSEIMTSDECRESYVYNVRVLAPKIQFAFSLFTRVQKTLFFFSVGIRAKWIHESITDSVLVRAFKGASTTHHYLKMSTDLTSDFLFTIHSYINICKQMCAPLIYASHHKSQLPTIRLRLRLARRLLFFTVIIAGMN